MDVAVRIYHDQEPSEQQEGDVVFTDNQIKIDLRNKPRHSGQPFCLELPE